MLCFFFFAPFSGAAQTLPEADVPARPLMLMSFMGDDPLRTVEFQDYTAGVLAELGGYSIMNGPRNLDFSPDQPPNPMYLRGAELALTGECYVDTDNMQHFQLWLWDGQAESLIHTDDLVFEAGGGALERRRIPVLIQWIFSFFQTAAVREEELKVHAEARAKEEARYKPSFFLGPRAGGLLNSSISQAFGGYETGVNHGFAVEGAAALEFRIFRFFSVQAEAVFSYDGFQTAKETGNGRSVDVFYSMALAFPLYIKIPIPLERFILSPFIGGFYVLPLKVTVAPKGEGEETFSAAYKVDPPVGLTLGLDLGFPLGPGELFMGLRFDKNPSLFHVENSRGILYSRSGVGLSVGYKFLLWKRGEEIKNEE
jgi:hypothetical protein